MTSITTNSSNIPKRYKIDQWDDENLDLKQALLRGIYAFGFEKPSAIQKQALYPMTVRPANDIIAQAQSGTGKTGAFVTGTLQIIDEKNPVTQALILAPTHELALQTKQVMDDIGRFLKVKTQLLVGGTSVENDKKQLSYAEDLLQERILETFRNIKWHILVTLLLVLIPRRE